MEDARARDLALREHLSRDRKRHARVERAGGDAARAIGERDELAVAKLPPPLAMSDHVHSERVAVRGLADRGRPLRGEREQHRARRSAAEEGLLRIEAEAHEELHLLHELRLESDLEA